jgi:hypothetical protein
MSHRENRRMKRPGQDNAHPFLRSSLPSFRFHFRPPLFLLIPVRLPVSSSSSSSSPQYSSASSLTDHARSRLPYDPYATPPKFFGFIVFLPSSASTFLHAIVSHPLVRYSLNLLATRFAAISPLSRPLPSLRPPRSSHLYIALYTRIAFYICTTPPFPFRYLPRSSVIHTHVVTPSALRSSSSTPSVRRHASTSRARPSVRLQIPEALLAAAAIATSSKSRPLVVVFPPIDSE